MQELQESNMIILQKLISCSLLLILIFSIISIIQPEMISIEDGNQIILSNKKPITKISDIPTGWNYGLNISIHPSSPDDNFQIKVQLTPTSFNYANTNLDGSDLRFFDLANNSLDYWIETWDTLGTSIVWVKVPAMGTSQIHMYYGNPSAVSESNGESTFLFFDDFPGTSLNSSKWTTSVESYSSLTITDGIIYLRTDTPTDRWGGVACGFSDYRINQGMSGTEHYADFNNGVSAGLMWGQGHVFQTNIMSNNTRSLYVVPQREWFVGDIQWVDDSLVYFSNGSEIVTHTNASTIPDIPLQVRILTMNGYAGPGTWWSAAIRSQDDWGYHGRAMRFHSYHDFPVGSEETPTEIQLDWVSVRKCAAVEPVATIPDVLTINTPEERSYSQPMSGYYPGTYGFEDQPHGTMGTNIDFIDEYYDTTGGDFVDIIIWEGPVLGHKFYIDIRDAQAGTYTWGVHYFDQPPVSGTIEFNLVVMGTVGTQYFELRATDDTPAIEMRVTFSTNKIQYYDGSSWQDIADFFVSEWLHNSISFDCEAGVNGQFSWIVSHKNGTEIGRVENNEFQNDLNTLDEMYFGSTQSDDLISSKYDAFGYSWDPYYNLGDNHKEGLLLNFSAITGLTNYSYSLDGFNKVQILGNKTIPMPTSGSHTIQVFGSDFYGIYASEVKYFQVDETIPLSITGPSDFSIYNGDTGYSILWTVEGSSPQNYSVYRNGTIYDTGTWTDSVLVWLDGLEEGRHNFTCVVENILDDTAFDEIWITVLPATPDLTPPVISSPADIAFEEGSIGYKIQWSGSDDRSPWWASAWRNGTLIYDQAWIGNIITIFLDGLSKNTYNFTCTLYDEAGNSVTDTVWVTVTETVPDTEIPIIIPPSPVIYEEGSTGNTLTWICSDAHPYAYQIRLNGTEFPGYEYEPWHGENITISCDDLTVNIWFFDLILWDLAGNNASSVAIVTVISEAPDITPPYVSQPTDLIVAENMVGKIVWEVSDAHPANYEILRNGSLVYKQDIWVSGIIHYHFTSLPLATWEFTLIVWDEVGFSSSSKVLVQVLPGSAYDTDPPEISHIADQIIEYGSTNNFILAYLFDEHPQGYSIIIVDTFTDITWSDPNVQVIVSLDGLVIGIYTVNITAWDIFGNLASRTFQVTVQGDITPPTLIPHPDMVVPRGSSVILTWGASDTSPSYYELINLTSGNIISYKNWTGGNITERLVNLPMGIHKIRIIVYDTYGNFGLDDVTIDIVEGESAPGFEIILVIPILLFFIIFRQIKIFKRRIKE